MKFGFQRNLSATNAWRQVLALLLALPGSFEVENLGVNRMNQPTTNIYDTFTLIAADQAQKLLYLAEADWARCQQYAATVIPEIQRDIYPGSIFIRPPGLWPEFELRRDGMHQVRDNAEAPSSGSITELTAVLAMY